MLPRQCDVCQPWRHSGTSGAATVASMARTSVTNTWGTLISGVASEITSRPVVVVVGKHKPRRLALFWHVELCNVQTRPSSSPPRRNKVACAHLLCQLLWYFYFALLQRTLGLSGDRKRVAAACVHVGALGSRLCPAVLSASVSEPTVFISVMEIHSEAAGGGAGAGAGSHAGRDGREWSQSRG